MKLSILICSLYKREAIRNKLLESLFSQLPALNRQYNKNIGTTLLSIWDFKDVEILVAIDDKQLKVGAKRNLLVKYAKGDNISFIDDDDRITPDYVAYLLEGIKKDLDVINFQVMYNPKHDKPKLVKYGLHLSDSESKECFYRASNHLMCIKREKALKVPFKNISRGEDSDFAVRLKRVCKTQGEIKKVLYYYDFNYETTETQ